MAIVIPDGVLTNSSLQYVRDAIEDWYRLVAVVSMPQTAFTATGAGVKSSVLFVKKHSQKHTAYLQELKTNIQNQIKAEFNYLETINTWEEEKKEKIKQMVGFNNTTGMVSVKEIKNSQEFKDWRTEVNQLYNEKITELQEEMTIRYQDERASQLPDYPIFMAIAENIGYDATGKSCAKLISKNEVIEGSYKSVIEHMSHDLFDEQITRKYEVHNEKEELSTRKEILQAGILKELINFINDVDNGRI